MCFLSTFLICLCSAHPYYHPAGFCTWEKIECTDFLWIKPNIGWIKRRWTCQNEKMCLLCLRSFLKIECIFSSLNSILSKVLQKPGHLQCTTWIEYVGAAYIIPEHLSVPKRVGGRLKTSSEKQFSLSFQMSRKQMENGINNS